MFLVLNSEQVMIDEVLPELTAGIIILNQLKTYIGIYAAVTHPAGKFSAQRIRFEK
jgi:hypothetical protein